MKQIKATLVEGQWFVELLSEPGKPITQREIQQFERSLKLKLRSYYLLERRASVATAAKVTKATSAQTVKVETTKEKSNG